VWGGGVKHLLLMLLYFELVVADAVFGKTVIVST